jgi:hypothetical protein
MAPIFVAYSSLMQQKYQAKNMASREDFFQVDQEQLQVLVFSLEEYTKALDWENEHEFEWNHKMYDVKSKWVTKDSVKIWCKIDWTETRINEYLQQLAGCLIGNHPTNGETQKLLAKIFASYYNLPNGFEIGFYRVALYNFSSDFQQHLLPEANKRVEHPPQHA